MFRSIYLVVYKNTSHKAKQNKGAVLLTFWKNLAKHAFEKDKKKEKLRKTPYKSICFVAKCFRDMCFPIVLISFLFCLQISIIISMCFLEDSIFLCVKRKSVFTFNWHAFIYICLKMFPIFHTSFLANVETCSCIINSLNCYILNYNTFELKKGFFKYFC